jgi:CheY-like chemotaxis protein
MKVLVLEDDPNRIRTFRFKFDPSFEVMYVTTAQGAIDLLTENQFDAMFLDHDLGGEQFVDTDNENTGSEVVRWLLVHSISNDPYIIVHSLNRPAATGMVENLLWADFKFVYQIPFDELIEKYLDDPSFLK